MLSAVTTSMRARAVLAIVSVIALGVGVAVGRSIAYTASLGGLEGIGGAITSGLFGIVIAVLLVVGVVAIRVRGPSTPIVSLLLAAGLAGVGAVGGWATAGATGGTYVAPVEHSARGSTRAELSDTLVPFVPRDAGEATCRSIPDGEAVAGITALDLGELGSGTLRAEFGPGTSVGDSVAIQLLIDGADVAEGSGQPFWTGTAQVVERAALGATGQLRFDRVPAENDAKTSAAQTGWDGPLTGSISWSCEPW
jgi:hypothetical protein